MENAALFQKLVYQCSFTMIGMGDDGNVSYFSRCFSFLHSLPIVDPAGFNFSKFQPAGNVYHSTKAGALPFCLCWMPAYLNYYSTEQRKNREDVTFLYCNGRKYEACGAVLQKHIQKIGQNADLNRNKKIWKKVVLKRNVVHTLGL